jgi:hypothetical protein
MICKATHAPSLLLPPFQTLSSLPQRRTARAQTRSDRPLCPIVVAALVAHPMQQPPARAWACTCVRVGVHVRARGRVCAWASVEKKFRA